MSFEICVPQHEALGVDAKTMSELEASCANARSRSIWADTMGQIGRYAVLSMRQI